MRSQTQRQVAVFSAVGMFNTAAYFVLAYVLHYGIELAQGAASYIAYVLLLPVSFIGHRRLTFSSQGALVVEWSKFCVAQAANLAIVWGVNQIAREGLWPAWVAFGAVSVLIPAFSFVFLKLWVFSRGSSTS